MLDTLKKILPLWLINYKSKNLLDDIIAGLVVGILVIPQSLGYAVLAGLDPIYGLYASIVPVLVYVYLGKSNVQAVGPVAITAIMTASSLSHYTQQSTAVYASMASLLAIMVGCILWLSAQLKLGWIMQFISRGVISGFVSAAALLIFMSQIKYITAISMSGNSVISYSHDLWVNFDQLHGLTLCLGGLVFVLLLLNRYAKKWLWQSWLPSQQALWVERLFPLLLLIVCTGFSYYYNWSVQGIKTVGVLPHNLPSFSLPPIPHVKELSHLLAHAFLLALIAFISSSAVTKFYTNKSNETFDANAELRALGVSNVFGGLFQSFTIAGGFSRTAINVDSGAKTQLASVITVVVMLVALSFLGSIVSPLPFALLGAIIMVSVIRLFDVNTFLEAYKADKLDAMCLAVTFVTALLFGLNTGLIVVLLVSFASLIWQFSQPHIAVVGVLGDTEHFRNINRHNVQTFENLLIMRIDESLFFGNSVAVHNRINQEINNYPHATEIILMMSAVNHIDFAAQEMLCQLNKKLEQHSKILHYTEIKGPVMDIVKKTAVIQELTGHVYLSTIQAVNTLKKM